MPEYRVEGTGIETGRKRSRVYYAGSVEEAISVAENDGTRAEEVTELPPEPPTISQLNYARSLGVRIPHDASKEDTSYLISNFLSRQEPNPRAFKFAEIYNIHPNPNIGKKDLFHLIHWTLSEKGRARELVSWFAFRVYRGLVDGDPNAPLEWPDNPVFIEIGWYFASDQQVVDSIRRYDGRELRWFGQWTAPDSETYSGGSIRTIAYRAVSKMLKERLNSHRHNRMEAKQPSFNVSVPKSSTNPHRQVERHHQYANNDHSQNLSITGILIAAAVLCSILFLLASMR